LLIPENFAVILMICYPVAAGKGFIYQDWLRDTFIGGQAIWNLARETVGTGKIVYEPKAPVERVGAG
jgi:hypothetical protein